MADMNQTHKFPSFNHSIGPLQIMTQPAAGEKSPHK